MSPQPYDDEFYAAQRDLSLRSAERVVPFLIDLVAPASVVDVGCGVGTWLRAFVDRGVTDVVGVEGEHIAAQQLEIDRSSLVVRSLADGVLDLDRTFDLALCMEVAEHLEERVASTFVRSLAALAPVVLFGAAVPHQGGDGHRNEQWQHWWAARFAEEGYLPVDAVRPHVWADPDVAWWYAQNTLLYVREGAPAAARLGAAAPVAGPLSFVHPAMLLEREAAAEHARLRPSIEQAYRALRRSMGSRITRRPAPRPSGRSRHTTLERLQDLR